MTQILDYLGRPIKTAELTKEIASSTVLQQRGLLWGEQMAGQATPNQWERIRQEALLSNPREYFELVENARDRDLHLDAVLGDRERAITGLTMEIVPASEKRADKKIAETIKDSVIDDDHFQQQVTKMIDAGLAYGFGMIEINWDKTTWLPHFEWRDPRYFTFDQDTGEKILVITKDNSMGEVLAPFKWISHIPQLRTGKVVRNGLMFRAIFISICKNLMLRNWMQFAEIFGHPLRVGKYDNGVSPDSPEIRILQRAVANLGIDGAAVIPKSMMIEFIEASTANGSGLFDSLVQYLDNQISKLVLGQTRTTDEQALGLAKASESGSPDRVRQEIIFDDAGDVERTLNRDLITPFIKLHFGEQAKYPKLRLPIPAKYDLSNLLLLIEKGVPLGVKIPVSYINEAFGIPIPDDDDEILAAPKAPEPAPAAPPDPKEETNTALNFQFTPGDDTFDYLGYMSGLAGDITKTAVPSLSLLSVANKLSGMDTLEDAEQIIKNAVSDGVSDIASRLATDSIKARVAGRKDVGIQPQCKPETL